MKISLIIPSVLIATMMACNQPAKQVENNTTANTNDSNTTKKTDQQKEGVYFGNLKDGDKVKSPVIIEMGVRGMTVEPAGKINVGKGHHHLIIDGTYIEKGKMVSKDDTHIHFGKGQTSDTLILKPGVHTLTLQFADGMHQSYGQDWSKTISITVEK